MRIIYLLIMVIAGIMISGNTFAQEDQQKNGVEINSEDSIEYELVIIDPRFESYLATVQYPKNYYSNEYYTHWNIQYCAEWNIRHQNPARYGDFYENYIHYDQSVDYGIDLNFKLYQYFQFIEKEYDIILIKRKGN